MQSVSSRIWTGIAVSISYDDNHYTTGTSQKWLNKKRSHKRYDGNKHDKRTKKKKKEMN